ncbi:arrestin domain-containing protein 2-like [Anopheles albimanus]|uniref:Arrestin C-terminal-like domain-containing protein n=1 Tax=Anopheles albimanus TaxID=7167 RepID=A0A8W7K8X5_ANOAL|nr:arrestin domain-containing protein 2-like [Anopheles albimanus]XP_035781915.1 arrestin domain-containing protein 2-like [Anopheles albimanus]
MPKEKTSKHVKCDIVFDNNSSGIFTAGDHVAGTIELHLTKIKKVRGVCLLISGYSNVFWEAKVPDGPKNKKVKAQFKGREDFIKQKLYLAGSENGTGMQLPPNSIRYRFDFQIPPSAPTSMEGKYGHVRYLLQVTLERPWKFDHNFQKPFTVVCLADLNQSNDVLCIPTKAEDMMTFYCGLCRSRPLMVSATTPRSGYTPGETIELEVFVQNSSKVAVSEIEIKFQKILKFISQTRAIGQTQIPLEDTNIQYEVLEVRKIPFIEGENDARFVENFTVNPIPSSETTHSKIVHVTYELAIIVKPQRSTKRMKLSIPVTIGKIPLAGTATPYSMSGGVQKLATALAEPSSAPPAYEE